MKRFFVAAGYGHRVGKGWTTTQVYEYAGFPGIDSVEDALENMRLAALREETRIC